MLLMVARPWRNWPRQARLLPLLGLGAAMAATILSFYLAIERLPLGIAIALQFLGPLAVAVFGSRQKVDLAWALLAATGVGFMMEVAPNAESLDPIGTIYALGSGACWASYILIGRVAGQEFGSSTAALAVSIAGLLILPVGIAHAGTSLLNVELLPPRAGSGPHIERCAGIAGAIRPSATAGTDLRGPHESGASVRSDRWILPTQ